MNKAINLDDLRHGVRVADLSIRIGKQIKLKNEELKK